MPEVLKKVLSDISPAGLTLIIYLIGQLMLGVIWATHEIDRITAIETKMIHIMNDQDQTERALDELQNRVDRQETPLGKRVDSMQERLQVINDRILKLDSRVDTLLSPRNP